MIMHCHKIIKDIECFQTFLAVNLVAIAFLNVFSAVFQGSVCANLGTFPVRYMGNIVNGEKYCI